MTAHRRQPPRFRGRRPETIERYGPGDFARGCLMARRLVESGVRMVQVYYGNNNDWDNHVDILGHRRLARLSDAPIAALLYGDGDLPKTLQTAFNFGWDCDNSAATAGTIVGVMQGYRSMMELGWDIKDRYANTTRENMPEDETITSFADRLAELAEQVIVEQGGEREAGFRSTYRIKTQAAANVAPLRNLSDEVQQMQTKMKPQIESLLLKAQSKQEKARAAYLAISLDLAGQMQAAHASAWSAAIEALKAYPQIAQVLYHHSPVPAAGRLQEQAAAAGLSKPGEKRELW